MHYKEIDKVLKEYARNIPDLSKRVGASIPAIYKWKQRDRIPKKYQTIVKKVIEYRQDRSILKKVFQKPENISIAPFV